MISLKEKSRHFFPSVWKHIAMNGHATTCTAAAQQPHPLVASPHFFTHSGTPANPAYHQMEPRVARRTFGLFCLCDFLLTFLLWTILLSVKKKKQSFVHMFRTEIMHYSMATSLADLVLLSVLRDTLLILCYIILKFKHWVLAGICALCSSAFLLSKVFLYPMSSSGQPVTYFTILASFAMTWIATYMVDFKKLRNPSHDFGSSNAVQPSLFFPNAAGHPTAVSGYPGLLRAARGSLMKSGNEDSNSVYVTVNGSEVGEENRRVLPLLEENDELNAIEKMAEIDSREAFEIGIRLKDLPADEWKLEECGAYGTCVCVRQMPELGRVYKLEMVINLSPGKLHQELCSYDNIPSWDRTLHQISLLHSFGDSTKVLKIVSNEIEGRKNIAKREFVVSTRTSILNDVIFCFGASINYPANNEWDSSNQSEGNYPSNTGDNNAPLTRGEYKILGYIINKIENDCNKCEFVRFLSTDIKSWIAQFRIDKAITQLLLTYAECLQSRVKSINQSENSGPNSTRDPGKSESYTSSA